MTLLPKSVAETWIPCKKYLGIKVIFELSHAQQHLCFPVYNYIFFARAPVYWSLLKEGFYISKFLLSSFPGGIFLFVTIQQVYTDTGHKDDIATWFPQTTSKDIGCLCCIHRFWHLKNKCRDRKVKTKLYTYLKHVLNSLLHSVPEKKTTFHCWVKTCDIFSLPKGERDLENIYFY